jgi:hypothetical protein
MLRCFLTTTAVVMLAAPVAAGEYGGCSQRLHTVDGAQQSTAPVEQIAQSSVPQPVTEPTEIVTSELIILPTDTAQKSAQ